jgi:hypothetical protein
MRDQSTRNLQKFLGGRTWLIVKRQRGIRVGQSLVYSPIRSRRTSAAGTTRNWRAAARELGQWNEKHEIAGTVNGDDLAERMKKGRERSCSIESATSVS